MRLLNYLLTLLLFTMLSCSSSLKSNDEDSDKPLFTLLTSEESGFFFINELNENENIHILNYEYLYNGGGVAIGDINNDGFEDIFMTGNLFGGRLFLNKGGMKFEQISDKANVYYRGFSTGVTMVDINEDGWLDIYICRSLDDKPEARANLLLINNKNNTFTEQAQKYGLADMGYSNHANFFDYDNDGDLDMFLLNHRNDFENALTLHSNLDANGIKRLIKKDYSEYNSCKFYRNNGDLTFTDITKKTGINNNTFGLSATIADINEDGWQDIYVANDYADRDIFYINNKNGTFMDRHDEMFEHLSKNSMGADIADFNNDGLLDVMNLDMLAEDNYRQKQLKGNSPYDKYMLAVGVGLGHQEMRNTMQLNTGKLRNGVPVFSEIAQLAGVSHTDWSWSPLFADFDNDGFKDLFISNGYARDVTDLDFLKYSSGEAINEAGGVNKLNRFELVKKMKTTPIANYIFKNNGNLTFTNKTKAWGLDIPTLSNGAAYADLDNDGDLDLVINNFNSPACLYRNNSIDLNKNKYLNIQLKGEKSNQKGIGTKIVVKHSGMEQTQYYTPNRGFLSSLGAGLHFGVGNVSIIDELYVLWPNGKSQTLKNIQPNQELILNIKDAKDPAKTKVSSKILLEEILINPLADFLHRENDFIDFKNQPLLEHQYSNLGPFVAKSDVNGDGLEDLYIGGSAGQSGTLYIQNVSGKFTKSTQKVFDADKVYEDTGVVFLDVDNDNDQDLYVVSGGAEFEENSLIYQDRLYLNDGKGNFSKTNLGISESSNGTCVKAEDFDNDGDTDLFVGGGILPNQYPKCSKSYLLQNNKGIFRDISAQLPNNGFLGIVNDAIWKDIDNDKSKDLIVVGEWMPILILKNTKQQFEDITSKSGLEQSNGWWNTIVSSDFDNDGDIDFVAGNRGNNSFFKATLETPAILYAKDFDGNGSFDAIPFYYFNDKKAHPKHSLDEIVYQIPTMRKKMDTYDKFSNATVDDIFSSSELSDALRLKAYTFESIYIENVGNGNFKTKPLPIEAQFSTIRSILVEDVNHDNNLDLMICGNDYGSDVDSGRQDASFGGILLGDGKGGFLNITTSKSGFFVKGDARQILSIKNLSNYLIFGNNQKISAFKPY